MRSPYGRSGELVFDNVGNSVKLMITYCASIGSPSESCASTVYSGPVKEPSVIVTPLPGSGSLDTATENAPPDPWFWLMVISETGACSSSSTISARLDAKPPNCGVVKVSVCQAVAWLPSTIAGRSASYSLVSPGASGTTRSTEVGTGSGPSGSSSSSAGSSSLCSSSSAGASCAGSLATGGSSSSEPPRRRNPTTTAKTSTPSSRIPPIQRPTVERGFSSVYSIA